MENASTSHFDNVDLGPSKVQSIAPPPYPTSYPQPSYYGQPVAIEVQQSYPHGPQSFHHQPTVIVTGQPICYHPPPFTWKRCLFALAFLSIPAILFLIVFFVVFGSTGGFRH